MWAYTDASVLLLTHQHAGFALKAGAQFVTEVGRQVLARHYGG